MHSRRWQKNSAPVSFQIYEYVTFGILMFSHYLIYASNAGRAQSNEVDDSEAALPRRHSQANPSQSTLDKYAFSGLSSNQASQVDSRLAAFIFKRGLPLSIIDDGELQGIINLANPTYQDQTTLSSFTLKGRFLPRQYTRICSEVTEKLKNADARCVLMDGWSGVQRRHALNLLLVTPAPYFLTNVYTGAEQCTAAFQFELVKQHVLSLPFPVHAICSDFASVMTATWKLLRSHQPGFLTFGCACHALQLLGRDVLKEPTYLHATTDTITVVTYFRRHLGNKGLASLQDLAAKIHQTFKQFCLPTPTRWNSHLACAESLLKNRPVLYSQVTHKDWTTDHNEQRLQISAIVHNQRFWANLQSYVDAAMPIRDCLLSLERDDACLSDVYNCLQYLNIKFSQLQPTYSAHCTTQLRKRAEFMLHPAHICAYILDHRYAASSSLATTQEYSVLSRVVSEVMRTHTAVQIETCISDFQLEKAKCMRGTPSGVNWYRPERSKISPLCWWAPLADQWPILHGLATILFNLPCSSSAAERVWSAADHIITKKRSRLSTDTSTKLISILWNERVLYKHKSSDLRKAEIPPHRCDLVALPFNYQWMTVPSSSASAPTANESNEDEYDEASYELDQAVEDNVQATMKLRSAIKLISTTMKLTR
jgi:hypothetical protein